MTLNAWEEGLIKIDYFVDYLLEHEIQEKNNYRSKSKAFSDSSLDFFFSNGTLRIRICVS